MPALIAGNTIVLKPSLQTPLTALYIQDLLLESGLPKNTLTIINCANEDAKHMINHDRVKLISFTGSTDVGFKIIPAIIIITPNNSINFEYFFILFNGIP